MIPRATFCQPQIASFGYTEEQAQGARATTSRPRSSRSPPTARRGASADGVGFVKIVADAKHNEIIGAHLIGPEVTELLPALTLAQKWDLTADEVARNVFAHPTLVRGRQGSRRGHRRPHDQPLTADPPRRPLADSSEPGMPRVSLPITTERLVLRSFRPGDEDDVFAYRSVPVGRPLHPG